MNHLLKYADMKKVIKGNFVSFYLFFQLKKILLDAEVNVVIIFERGVQYLSMLNSTTNMVSTL